MMQAAEREDIQYCTHCGAVNQKSATVCQNCEKKILTTYKPFYEFLKRHIKSDLQDKVTDSVYSVLKHYRLSHLYGIVLTISIIATGTAFAVNTTPYIKTVTEYAPSAALQTAQPTEAPIEPATVSEDTMQWLTHVVVSYDGFADSSRDYDRYWELSDEYGSVEELYAENAIAGYEYAGVHELISNPIVVGRLVDESEASHIYYNRYLDENTLAVGAGVRSALGQKLHADGYNVIECDYVLAAHTEEYDFENPTRNTMERVVYRMVFVEGNERWYLAEDRLTERIGA